MINRFTERAETIIYMAQQKARQNGDNMVYTEHILWAIFAEGHGVGAQALAALGLNGQELEQDMQGMEFPNAGSGLAPHAKTAITAPRGECCGSWDFYKEGKRDDLCPGIFPG